LPPFRFLVTPILRRKALDQTQDPVRRLHAAVALAALGSPGTDVVVQEAASAPPDERDNNYAAPPPDAIQTQNSLGRRCASIGSDEPNAARARAVAAVLSLSLDAPASAVEMTRLDAPPADRAYFIEHLPAWSIWTDELIAILAGSSPPELCSALCAG